MEDPITTDDKVFDRDIEDESRSAKAYLLTASSKTGENLYDHLVNSLTKLLEDRPSNALDIFEELSREGKRAKFREEKDAIQDQEETPSEVDLATDYRSLFERKEAEIPNTVDSEIEEGVPVLGDILEHAYYFEQANVGIGREETFRIFLALKQLSDSYLFKVCRFWGKILGIEANYYVAEAQFVDGEDPLVEEEDETASQQEAAEAKENLLLGDEQQSESDDDLPKVEYKAPPQIPKEEWGTGCNAKAYFVCNEPGQPWHRLPSVTPQQISIARLLRKFMTGRLDTEIVSYPPFHGNEANYLRAQIARISATTHVSPQGYYIFDENDEEDEDGIGPDHFEINLEFEGLPLGELTDPSLSFWVHHMQYILPQGRCSWFNPSLPADEEDEEDEEDDEEREEPDEPEPESGPPLLTPLSEDSEVDGMPPWSVTKSTNLIPQYAIAVLHSNLWPGAHAYCVEKKFENIYVGWGLKYSADNYSPPIPPPTQEEYPSGPEVTESEDPTVEAERALKAAQQEALEQEEEEEEESDEYDDQ